MATERTERPALPTGIVTFLRTDVEGSMRLARAIGGAWDELNTTQLRLIREAVEAHGGVAVRTEGDAVFAVFREAIPAVHAAIDLQRAIAGHPWPDGATVRVRAGLHTGEAHLAGDDYGGFDVNRAARVAAVGHGGQIILSDPTRSLVEPELPDDVSLRDLGRHPLKDVPQPEHLFQLDAAGLPTDFSPLRTGATTAGNLPPRLTSFVARDREVRELTVLLESARLVTITGPGGIGKTSLAIELARSLAATEPDGTWIVPLDVVTDPAFVPAAIARTLAIYDGPGRPLIEGVAQFLADRRALLVLDNFEHVVEAAGAVATLLRAAPRLRIIATSRAPLHIGGEQEYPLGTLAGDAEDAFGGGAGGAGGAPDGLSAAARLFVERARAAQPGWEPGTEADVVEEICRLVDGLPLGIELAAARITLLPPAVIRDRLAARLPLPGGGPRDVPARQRTLDGTIAWSYELLDPGRRRLVRELAVFEGGFDLEQVRRVATLAPGEDALDALFELVDRSLIARSAISGHLSGLGSVRFRMLETIRTFALRELVEEGTESATRRRHAEAMLELAETAAPHMLTPDQVRWLDRLASDHANLAAAIRWAVESGEVGVAQRLSWATWRYWQLGGHLREGRTLADAVIDMAGADEPSPGRMWSFAAAGGLAYWQADTPRAAQLYRAELEAADQIGHPAGEADAWFNLSATEAITGNREEAAAFLQRARERYSELGDKVALARTDWGVANMALLEPGHELEGVGLTEAARQKYAETGDVMYEALAAGSLAFAYQALGRSVEALRVGIEAIAMTHAIRDVATTTISLADAAILLLDFNRSEEAATLMGAYHRLCDLHGVQPPAGLGQIIAWSRVEERSFQNLSSDEHAAATRRGRAMSLDAAVAFAIATAEDVLRELPESGSES